MDSEKKIGPVFKKQRLSLNRAMVVETLGRAVVSLCYTLKGLR